MSAWDELADMIVDRPEEAAVRMETGRISRVSEPGRTTAGQVDVVLDDDGSLQSCTSWTSNFDEAVARFGRTALAGKTVVLLIIGGRYYPDSVISGGG